MRIHVLVQDGLHLAEDAKSDFDGFLARIKYEDPDGEWDDELVTVKFDKTVPKTVSDRFIGSNCKLLAFATNDDQCVDAWEMEVPDDAKTVTTDDDGVWQASTSKEHGWPSEAIYIAPELDPSILIY